MYPLRARWLALAFLPLAATLATAQSLNTASPASAGLGSGLSLGVRSDYTPGLKWISTEPGLDASALPENKHTSLYADWFPFGDNAFRVVGGIALHDTSANPQGTGSASGYGYGNNYLLRPRTTTYLGIGYGSHGLDSKGLGFYADMGFSLGADGDASQNGLTASATDGWRSQNNGWLGFRYLPSVSLGLIYRY